MRDRLEIAFKRLLAHKDISQVEGGEEEELASGKLLDEEQGKLVLGEEDLEEEPESGKQEEGGEENTSFSDKEYGEEEDVEEQEESGDTGK